MVENGTAPAWRQAWRTDDAAWMKARKAEWKTVKRSPALADYGRDDLAEIREFFLSGSAVAPGTPERDWPIAYDPDINPLPVPASVLLECWLLPQPSEDAWSRITARSQPEAVAAARHRLRECLYSEFPPGSSPFGGLEERLYRFFGPTRCRQEDFPEFPRESYLKRAWTTNSGMLEHFLAYLQPDPNPYLIAPALLPEFLDTVVPTYDANAEVEGGQAYFAHQLSELAAKARAMSAAKGASPEQAGFCRQLLTDLEAMELPAALKGALSQPAET